MKKVLFLSPRISYPLDTGGKIRTYHILRLLSERSYVLLLSFAFSSEDVAYAEELKKKLGIEIQLFSPSPKFVSLYKSAVNNVAISIQKYISDEMAKEIIQILRKDKDWIVHCDHLHMGWYVSLIKKFFDDVFVRIDEHNVEYLIRERMYKERRFLFRWIVKREYVLTREIERFLCDKANEVWVVSDEDKGILVDLGIDEEKILVVPNAVDIDYFVFNEYSGDERDLVFIGSMDWFPNEDGMIYFLSEIFPKIKRRIPDVRFWVVGRNPSKRLRSFGYEGVIITGAVDDVRQYLKRAAVVVVPLRIGGGTRLKILEAMASGRCVVSTSLGAEGIDAKDGEEIIIADDPDSFCDKVVQLLEDIDKRKKIAISARRLVEKNYVWKLPKD